MSLLKYLVTEVSRCAREVSAAQTSLRGHRAILGVLQEYYSVSL